MRNAECEMENVKGESPKEKSRRLKIVTFRVFLGFVLS